MKVTITMFDMCPVATCQILAQNHDHEIGDMPEGFTDTHDWWQSYYFDETPPVTGQTIRCDECDRQDVESCGKCYEHCLNAHG